MYLPNNEANVLSKCSFRRQVHGRIMDSIFICSLKSEFNFYDSTLCFKLSTPLKYRVMVLSVCWVGSDFSLISSFNPWETIIPRTYNHLRIFDAYTMLKQVVREGVTKFISVVTYNLSPYRSVTYHSDSFVFTRHFMWANVLRFLEIIRITLVSHRNSILLKTACKTVCKTACKLPLTISARAKRKITV